MAEQGMPGQASQPGPSPHDSQAYKWGMLCHLSALAGIIIPPLGIVLGPLIFWLLKRNEYPFVDAQGKVALNFQISVLIYGFMGAAMCSVLMVLLIGFVLLPLWLSALSIFDLIMIIMASVKASNGQTPHYPCAIRFFA